VGPNWIRAFSSEGRQAGTLLWTHGRGYGFIQPGGAAEDDKEKQVFCHASKMVQESVGFVKSGIGGTLAETPFDVEHTLSQDENETAA
jgi:cold shock CspA family protein